jgi:hypothetical protein
VRGGGGGSCTSLVRFRLAAGAPGSLYSAGWHVHVYTYINTHIYIYVYIYIYHISIHSEKTTFPNMYWAR